MARCQPVATGKRACIAILKRGVIINLLNPKLTLFILTFLPQFITPDPANPGAEAVRMGMMLVGETFDVFLVYRLFPAPFRDRLIPAPTSETQAQSIWNASSPRWQFWNKARTLACALLSYGRAKASTTRHHACNPAFARLYAPDLAASYLLIRCSLSWSGRGKMMTPTYEMRHK